MTKAKIVTVGMLAPPFALVQGGTVWSPKETPRTERNGSETTSEGDARVPFAEVAAAAESTILSPAPRSSQGQRNRDAATARVVALEDWLTQGHAVLYFMRAFYCLACRRSVRRLASLQARLLSYGAAALIIGPGPPYEAADMARRLKVPFPVLADEDGQVAFNYGFRRTFLNAVMQSGTVLVDQKGVIRYVRRTANPRASLDVDALFLALRHL